MTWYSWGYNDVGQPGRDGWTSGAWTNLTDAQPTSFPAEIVDILPGEFHGAACSSSGDVYGWGYVVAGGGAGRTVFGEQFAALASGTGVLNPPTQLEYAAAVGAVEVAQTIDATFWRRADGSVWGVGNNRDGEFGMGEAVNTYHATPVQLTGLPADIVRLRPYFRGGLWAIDSSGQVWFAGRNQYGMDGDAVGGSSTTRILTHKLVDDLGGGVADVWGTSRPPVTGVSAGDAAMALLEDGTMMFWGRSMTGTASTTLHPPTALSGVTGIEQIYATGGGRAVYMLTTAGEVLALGEDAFGALANGTWSGSTYTEVDHFALPPVSIAIPGDRLVARLMRAGPGTYAMLVVTTDGQVWGWGLNDLLWGDSDPDPGQSVKVPPLQIFPSVFPNGVTDLVLLSQAAPFVRMPALVAQGVNQVSIVG